MIIHLEKILYDRKACDGTWCKAPYPGHPNGCPNFPDCIKDQKLEFYSPCELDWYAVIEDFDLKTHAQRMKEKHSDWSDRQCRCVLYWQNSVRKILRKKAEELCLKVNGCVITLCPEALGVNVFGTMAKHGLILYKNPNLVHKIAFVGVYKEVQSAIIH